MTQTTFITPQVSIEDGRLLFKGAPVDNALAQQILNAHSKGIPVEGRAKIFETLQTFVPGSTEAVELLASSTTTDGKIRPSVVLNDGLIIIGDRIFTDDQGAAILRDFADDKESLQSSFRVLLGILERMPPQYSDALFIPLPTPPALPQAIVLTPDVSILDNQVLFKGVVQDSVLSKHILMCHALGENATPIAEFLGHLMSSPRLLLQERTAEFLTPDNFGM